MHSFLRVLCIEGGVVNEAEWWEYRRIDVFGRASCREGCALLCHLLLHARMGSTRLA